MTIRASRDAEAIQPVGAETRKRERLLHQTLPTNFALSFAHAAAVGIAFMHSERWDEAVAALERGLAIVV